MRGENQTAVRQWRERGAHAIRHGFDEAGMGGERTNLDDFRRAFSGVGAGLLDIFQILAATGVGTERRSRERQGAADSVRAHLTHYVRQKGMPVAIAPINRYFQYFSQRGREFAILIVDGAAPIEVIIVFGDR